MIFKRARVKDLRGVKTGIYYIYDDFVNRFKIYTFDEHSLKFVTTDKVTVMFVFDNEDQYLDNVYISQRGFKKHLYNLLYKLHLTKNIIRS